MRRRLGKVACGQCRETVIRADERTVITAQTDTEADTEAATVAEAGADAEGGAGP